MIKLFNFVDSIAARGLEYATFCDKQDKNLIIE